MAIIINGQGRVGVRVAAPSGGGGGGTDADAQAFITAASITNSTQQSAINTLVVDLKAANVWTKMKALYPFVGGNASSHKFNLKDPRDLDAAYRLVFNGGWTHSSTGALPNGTTGYADTKITPSIDLSYSSVHTSYYSRSNISLTSTQILFDSFIGSSQCYQFYFDTSGNNIVSDSYNVVSGRNLAPISSFANRTDGLFISNRLSSSSHKIQRNNSVISTTTTIGGAQPNIPLYMAAANTTGGAVVYSKLETSFASIGDGLTDAEASAFYTAVQAFQTTLGRQVA